MGKMHQNEISVRAWGGKGWKWDTCSWKICYVQFLQSILAPVRDMIVCWLCRKVPPEQMPPSLLPTRAIYLFIFLKSSCQFHFSIKHTYTSHSPSFFVLPFFQIAPLWKQHPQEKYSSVEAFAKIRRVTEKKDENRRKIVEKAKNIENQ